VRLIEAGSGVIAARLDWKCSMLGVAWSRDGRFVASGAQDGTVHFWRLSSGKDSMMTGYATKPTALAWSADSRWLATGGGETITVWPFDGRGPERRAPRSLEAHADPISALAFAPQGRLLAAGCRGGALSLWELPGDAPLATFLVGARVEALAWAGRDRLIAATAERVFALAIGGSG